MGELGGEAARPWQLTAVRRVPGQRRRSFWLVGWPLVLSAMVELEDRAARAGAEFGVTAVRGV